MEDDLFDDHPVMEDCIVGNKFNTRAMIDTGSTGYCFVDRLTAQEICEKANISPVTLNRRKEIKAYDGRKGKPITQAIYPSLKIGNHTESSTPMLITELGQRTIILGKPWMRKHGVSYHGHTNSISFRPDHCNHLGAPERPFPSSPIRREEPGSTKDTTPIFQPKKILKRDEPDEKNHSNSNPISVRRSRKEDILKQKSWRKDAESEEALDIAMIGADPFNVLTKQKDVEIFAVSLRDINFELAKGEKPITDPKTIVPPEYHDFLDVFSKEKADELPPHRKHDHTIELLEGKGPGHAPLYNMSEGELLPVKRYLEENLKKGFITASSAPFASPILFAKKPSGGLRFCVDYRKLNEITKKNRYPLPLISEIMSRLARARFLTRIDIRHAFNRLRMKTEKDEDLTTFRTRFGSYKSLVLPFGLTNGPATFQNFINDTFLEYLDEFLIAYLDDLLVYSETMTDHRKHVRKVLQKLREAGIQADVDKCEFHVTETKFLGVVVGRNGIKMDPTKIEAVVEWAIPRHLKQVQAFLGFINFYRRFIKDFSKIAKPLVHLTRKDEPFNWTPACQAAFSELKRRVTEAPVLAHFSPSRETFVESDSSDYVSAGVLSQRGEDGLIRPVAFFSKSLLPAECNYEIYDKELLAIIKCFEQWRPELQSTELPIKVLTDHKSLEYFMTTKKLNRRQARWAEFLADFNFVITYQAGKFHTKADALTRRPGDRPESEEDDRQRHQHQIILPLKSLDPQIQKEMGFEMNEINAEKSKDPLENNAKLFVPEEKRMKLIQEVHDQPAVGHPGIKRTYEMMKKFFFWPKMKGTIEQYIRNCHTCKRAKAPRDGYSGLLNPLPIPDRPWTDISMDFVTGLPESKGHNAILMVVDRFSKMHHYIPCTTDEEGTTAEETARMLIKHVWKLHGLPTTIISDRGPQFVSLVWKSLCVMLGIKAKLSTAFHPETDGQSEISNQEMERYLRTYVNYQQDDWTEWLSMAEFASNACVSASSGLSPFQVNYGFEPRMSFYPIDASTGSARERILKTRAKNIGQAMEKIWEFGKENLVRSQESQKRFADNHREEAPTYKEGDEVWLSTKNIKTERPSKKLDHKMIGPYKILKALGNSYKLDLPASMKIHDVFHSSLLRPASKDPLPGQIPPPPPPVIIDNEEEFEIDDILDSRTFNKKLQYKVKWSNYPPDNTWYPAEDFANSKETVEEYHRKYPKKPRPKLIT